MGGQFGHVGALNGWLMRLARLPYWICTGRLGSARRSTLKCLNIFYCGRIYYMGESCMPPTNWLPTALHVAELCMHTPVHRYMHPLYLLHQTRVTSQFDQTLVMLISLTSANWRQYFRMSESGGCISTVARLGAKMPCRGVAWAATAIGTRWLISGADHTTPGAGSNLCRTLLGNVVTFLLYINFNALPILLFAEWCGPDIHPRFSIHGWT